MWAVINAWAVLNILATVALVVVAYIDLNPWAVLIYPAIDDFLIDCCDINKYWWRNIIKIVFTIFCFPAILIYSLLQTVFVMSFVIVLCASTIFSKERH